MNVDVTNGRLVVTDHWPGDDELSGGTPEPAATGAQTQRAVGAGEGISPEKQAVYDWYTLYDLSIEQVLDTLAGTLAGLVSLQDICPHKTTIRQQAEPDVGLSALAYCDVCGAVINET